MTRDTHGHGLPGLSTEGHVSLYMNGKEMRSRYFTNRSMRREIMAQWNTEIKGLQKLNKNHDFEIRIKLVIRH